MKQYMVGQQPVHMLNNNNNNIHLSSASGWEGQVMRINCVVLPKSVSFVLHAPILLFQLDSTLAGTGSQATPKTVADFASYIYIFSVWLQSTVR